MEVRSCLYAGTGGEVWARGCEAIKGEGECTENEMEGLVRSRGKDRGLDEGVCSEYKRGGDDEMMMMRGEDW